VTKMRGHLGHLVAFAIGHGDAPYVHCGQQLAFELSRSGASASRSALSFTALARRIPLPLGRNSIEYVLVNLGDRPSTPITAVGSRARAMGYSWPHEPTKELGTRYSWPSPRRRDEARGLLTEDGQVVHILPSIPHALRDPKSPGPRRRVRASTPRHGWV
jgi:hypothetical protein